MLHLPKNYRRLKGIEWENFSGSVAGSEQPGIDDSLLSNLEALYQQDIRIIYSLIIPSFERDAIKDVWESGFRNTKYITDIEDVSISIEDYHAPTQKQLQLITEDAAARIKNGEHILVHCAHGMGRTGTILAAIYMKLFLEYDAIKAIKYIRLNYAEAAIETIEQEDSLKLFGDDFVT